MDERMLIYPFVKMKLRKMILKTVVETKNRKNKASIVDY